MGAFHGAHCRNILAHSFGCALKESLAESQAESRAEISFPKNEYYTSFSFIKDDHSTDSLAKYG